MIKKLVFFLFLLLISSNELKADYESKVQQSVDSLLALSHVDMRNVDLTSAMEKAEKALSLSKFINYSSGIARSSLYMAQSYFYNGNYDEALKQISVAKNEHFAESNPKVMSEICRVRGQIFSVVGLSDASIASFKEGLDYIDKITIQQERDYLKSLAYENLYTVYSKMGDTTLALLFIKRNLDLLEGMDESFVYTSKINLYSTIASFRIRDKQYIKAQEFLERALMLSKKYEFPYTSRIYSFWGDLEYDRKDFDLALIYYYKALENLKQNNLSEEMVTTYHKIALVYEFKSNPDSVAFYKSLCNNLKHTLYDSKFSTSQDAIKIIKREYLNKIEKNNLFNLILGVIITLVVLFLLFIIYKCRYRKSSKLHCASNDNNNLVEDAKLMNEGVLKEIPNSMSQVSLEQIDQLNSLAQSNSPGFLPAFQKLYPNLTYNLREKHPDLTTSDLVLCAYIYLNFSSKDIAKFTFIQFRSVQTKKSRLRKKLGLNADTTIYSYLMLLN